MADRRRLRVRLDMNTNTALPRFAPRRARLGLGAKKIVSERHRSDTRLVSHPGDKIHIPLKTDEALRLALHVKPTKDMPRPGASKTKGQKLKKKQKRSSY